jgi:hypothetical protein
MYTDEFSALNDEAALAPGHKTISSNFKTGLDGWTVGDIASPTSTAPDPNNPPTFNPKGGGQGRLHLHRRH